MRNHLKKMLCPGIAGLCLHIPCYARHPVWTFSAPNPATVIISQSGNAAVQYTVTNNSVRPKNLIMVPAAGLSASACYLANKGSTCLLTVTIDGSQLPKTGVQSGPILCHQGNPLQCFGPKKANVLSIEVAQSTQAPILSASVSNLALSASGASRSISITNTGNAPATNLSLTYPSWPLGTSVNPSSTCVNGSTLAIGASCTITITPGATATSNCTTGIAATPGVITVSANNSTATINTLILNYGCQYQGGFLFSIDDSTPTTGSISGKVLTLTDQAAPLILSGPQSSSVIWSSNGQGFLTANVSFDVIPGIDDTSTSSLGSPAYTSAGINDTAFTNMYAPASVYYAYTNPNPFTAGSFNACNGTTDGKCNQANIYAYYSHLQTNYTFPPPRTQTVGVPTPNTYYPAGLCATTINGYADWYLPAICELDLVPGNMGCAPGTQSAANNLSFLIGDPTAGTPSTSCNPPAGTNCLAGLYWSSTSLSVAPESFVYVMDFTSTGSTGSFNDGVATRNGVRCARSF